MARILGQLRCARCQHVFLPEWGAETSLLVVCPACGASHANPGAHPGDRIRSGPFAAWAERYWVDDLPSDVHTPSPLVVDWTATTFAVDSISCAMMTFRSRIVILAAAVLPPGRAPLATEYTVALGVGGVVAKFPAGAGGRDAPARFAADLRAWGAEPVWPLEELSVPEEVSAPEVSPSIDVIQDEAADARLESRRLTCGQCGAPFSMATLVGDDARCPYCATPQVLARPLAEELALYHRRARAAQLHTPIAFDVPARALALAVGESALACVVCGAPNVHRAGATDERCTNCRAALIPNAAGMARAIANEHAAGKRAHGRAAGAAAHRDIARRRREGLVMLAPLAAVMAAYAVYAVIALSLESGDKNLPGALCGIGVLAVVFGSVFGAMAVYAVVARRRRRAEWRDRFAPLAEQLGAVQDDDLSAWAEHFWGDRIDSAWLVPSASRTALTFVAHGFAIAIAVDTVGSTPGLFALASPAHAAVLLGTSLPRDASLRIKSGEPARLADVLARAGFDVELRSGGLVAHASMARLARMRSQPAELAVLAPAAYTLVRLAQALRDTAPQ